MGSMSCCVSLSVRGNQPGLHRGILNFSNLLVSRPEHAPIANTTSSIPSTGTFSTVVFLQEIIIFRRFKKEKDDEPKLSVVVRSSFVYLPKFMEQKNKP